MEFVDPVAGRDPGVGLRVLPPRVRSAAPEKQETTTIMNHVHAKSPVRPLRSIGGATFATGTVALAALSALGALALGACNKVGANDTNRFEPIGTAHPSAAASPFVVEGKLLVYLASEALSGVGGTNFNAANGDPDTGDDCAVVVDMATKDETDLGVATSTVKIVGTDVYLIVSEAADSKDWGGAVGTTDTVLLHWSKLAGTVSFVDVIAAGANSIAVAGGRLYYVRGDTTALVNGDTSLAYVTAAAPTTPVTVLSTDAANTLFPVILGVDEDLLFLSADENVEGRDLNGDTDPTDPFVLALLDGSDPAAIVRVVGLSIPGLTTPCSARSTGSGDWLVGFLVDEATQSNFVTGLNDPTVGAFGFGGAWKPNSPAAGCGVAYVDADTLDDVLHVIDFSAWDANPVVAPPVNTGLPGKLRVLCTTDSVGVLVAETDDGGCDLNNDGDTADNVLRWVRNANLKLPFGNSTQLNAVETTTPGGIQGVSDLDDRFLCVVSESQDNTDHDTDTLKTHNLVAWIDPNAGVPTWVFDHGTQPAVQAAGASWMLDRPARDRLLVAFQESVINLAINTGDNDKTDSVPTFVQFDSAVSNDLDFPGPAVAVPATNPGIVLAGGYAMYRVDESADNRDWNGDNVKDDFVLFRTNVSSNFSSLIGFETRATANNLSGDAIQSSGGLGAAYLADESMAGADLNKPVDGRSDGYVVTWFRIN